MTITLKVYKDSPEYKDYMYARFPKTGNYTVGTPATFEFKGHRWKYEVTSFDDSGDYDLLWRPDGKESELMESDSTLRDKFAKAALQPLIAHFDYGRIGLTQERMDAIAKEAYGMADAMLKARG